MNMRSADAVAATGEKAQWRELDAALLAIRRLIEAPASRPVLHQSDGAAELSTILVVDAVARLTAEHGECSVGDVAQHLRVAHSTASRFVDRAVRVQVVARARATLDPRRTHLTLTEVGRELDEQAVDFRARRLAQALATWADEDVATFIELLQRFGGDADALQSPPPKGSTP